MYRKIATFAKHSAVYGFGSVGTRALGFLLIPLYTRFMSPTDYGVLALCTTTVGVLKILSLGGIPTALFRSYLFVDRAEVEKDRILGTALTTLLVSGLVLLAGMVTLRQQLGLLIFGSAEQSRFVLLIAGINFCYVFQAVRNANFRMKDESARFATFTFLTFFVTLAFSIYLVVGRGLGAWGAMSANLIGMGLLAALFIPWSIGRIRRGFSTRIFKELVGYGLPLIPGGVAVWAMNLSDVYLLRIFHPASEVGLYNLGYKFGLGIYIVTNALKTAFPKVIFSEVGDPSSARLFARVPTYYVVSMGFLCLAVSAFSPEIILIADSRFHVAQTIIPFAVFAYFFNGLVPLIEIGLDIQRRPYLLALVYIVGATVNIVLNLIFIPRYGMQAAALTTLVTYILLLVIAYILSRMLFPLHLEWRRLGIAAATLSVIGILIYFSPFAPGPGNAAYKALLLATYVPGILALRLFNSEETSKLRSFISRRRARKNN